MVWLKKCWRIKTVGKSVDFIWSSALTQFSCQQESHMLVYKKICLAQGVH
jgi:hypothetical protein